MTTLNAAMIIPPKGGQMTLAASGTSANVAIPNAGTFEYIRLKNVGDTNAAYVAFGTDNTVVAVGPTSSIGDLALYPGDTIDLKLTKNETHIAVLAAASTTTVTALPFDLAVNRN